MGAVHTGLYVIMGVSGSGKTLIGAQLARELDIAFVEGDDLHPPENVERMAAGTPLTDADRRDWLLAIAARLQEAKRAGTGLAVSCSALKRSYRSEKHTSELQSPCNLVCRLLLEKKKKKRPKNDK